MILLMFSTAKIGFALAVIGLPTTKCEEPFLMASSTVATLFWSVIFWLSSELEGLIPGGNDSKIVAKICS